MPYPSKLTRDIIVTAAIEMIEAEGMEKLSTNELAKRLGVKTPSLYRYVESRTVLLREVNAETSRALFRALAGPLAEESPPTERLLSIARAYRTFAHSRPITYGLAYTNTIPELYPDAAEQEKSVLPFQALMAEIAGEAESLPALRGFLALMHGFVMLELAGQFQRGGDLNAAFEASLTAYLRGWGR